MIIAPDASAASTTSTPTAIPAMIRLRRGNEPARAGIRGGNSLTRAPPAATTCWKSSRCSGG
ncbi:MAG: hypothetical protein U0574_04575 [Phycisphaerales bacterium]